MAKLNQTIKNVCKILKEDTRGLTIQELSDLCKVSRITMSIALSNLVGSKKIIVRPIGRYKLHYWRFK